MTRAPILLAGLALVLIGCVDEPAAPEVQFSAEPSFSVSIQSAVVAEDLAVLRAATARFHRFENALAAGYTFLFGGMCMEGQTGSNAGGMGYHYVNTDLLDGNVDIAHPEALLYEPGPNGQMRLVAVEYVIPKGAWAGTGLPTLLGQDLELNSFDLYALHVWIWKHNPEGLYKPWNPDVSCAHATPTTAH